MFIADKLVFVELHKTACTHIDELLRSLVDGCLEGKHNRPYPSLFNGQRHFIGSVRNPWEWYVSLWAFGCQQKGGVYKRVTTNGWNFNGISLKHGFSYFWHSLNAKLSKSANDWQECYADANDPTCFQQWMRLLHEPNRSFDLGEGYALAPMHHFAGLLTYRYFYLFCSNAAESRPFEQVTNYQQLSQFEGKKCFINSFIRNEELEADFIAALSAADIHLTPQQQTDIYSRKKTNASIHASNIKHYYDQQTNQLVESRERFIIEKFGYQSPFHKGQ